MQNYVNKYFLNNCCQVIKWIIYTSLPRFSVLLWTVLHIKNCHGRRQAPVFTITHKCSRRGEMHQCSHGLCQKI